MAEAFSRADWALRSEEFGDLDEYATSSGERMVVMTFRTPGIGAPDLDWTLWKHWLELPPDPRVLEPMAITEKGELLLRYAALDWKHAPVPFEAEADVKRVATWGIDFTRLYDFLSVLVPDEDIGWFACAFVKLDLRGAPRVGFLNPAGSVALSRRIAPEVLANFPRADARSLVFAVGQLLLQIVAPTRRTANTPLGRIIMQCLAADPNERFQSLARLRDAFAIVGGARKARYGSEQAKTWTQIETALGYAAFEKPARALYHFETALKIMPRSELARAGVDLMHERGAGRSIISNTIRAVSEDELTELERLERVVVTPRTASAALPVPPQRCRNWKDVRVAARTHVDAGRYAAAIELYDTSILSENDAVEILVGTADCHFLAREYGTAIDYARQALDRDPGNARAHAIQAEAWFKRRELAAALDAVNAWLALVPSDGHASYVAAKILLALGRLSEARDACDRATELAPKHLPAMLLRRQIDRSIKRLRGKAGHAPPAPNDLPEHLRDLRVLLVQGRTADALALLERPEYATDEAARLLRADLLAFTEQLDTALVAYEALGGLVAGVGRATVLVKLGRATEALALSDLLVREHPNASEAYEARALALQALGRGDEADEAMKRALAVDSQRTQMRVKLAGTPSGGR